MLSAHQPFERFPALIKQAAREAGGVAQVAGGVPAMCDGVTQGQPGMELSLFSRDVIALATAVGAVATTCSTRAALSRHLRQDRAGPGDRRADLRPPAGDLRARRADDRPACRTTRRRAIRQLYAEGKVGRDELLEAEAQSYHGARHLHLLRHRQHQPDADGDHGPAPAGRLLRQPEHAAARRADPARPAQRALEITALGNEYTPVGEVVDERAIVNGVVGLHATGGSTNHTHPPGRHGARRRHRARPGTISPTCRTSCRCWPASIRTALADVNHFHAAGGMGFLIRELLDAGLLHDDVRTVAGDGGLRALPRRADARRRRRWSGATAPRRAATRDVLAPVAKPFSADGGLKLLNGNLGRAVIKISAVKPRAPRRSRRRRVVFDDQDELHEAFKRGELDRDFVAVVRFQGPQANGMPELHKLTPALGVLQDRGLKVALVTDGRMSGASGKVPAAIHVTPEAVDGGPIARVRDGDIDPPRRRSPARSRPWSTRPTWAAREPATADLDHYHHGLGRELFAAFRAARRRRRRGCRRVGRLVAA